MNGIDHLAADRRRVALTIAPAQLTATGFREVFTAGRSDLYTFDNPDIDYIVTAELTSLDVVQAARLLQPGGILEAASSSPNLALFDLMDLARSQDFQILALDPRRMLVWRKRELGWRSPLAEQAGSTSVAIVRVASAVDGGPVIPARGRYAKVALWVQDVPDSVDLQDLAILVDGVRARATVIEPPAEDGIQRIDAQLPELGRTGLLRLELQWFGHPVSSPATIRVIPPPPLVPHVVAVAGSTSRLAGITVTVEELTRPDEFSATLDGNPVWGLESICTDPEAQRYDIHFQLPEDAAAGLHQVQLSAGRRKLPRLEVEFT